LEELARQKESADADKQRIASELQRKEQQIATQASEREALESLIRDMELKLVGGGQALEDKAREQAEAYRAYQQRLVAERKKQKQLRDERRRKEEEVLTVQRQYKDLQEEVSEKGKVIDKLKELYSRTKQEIKDLKEEQQGDRDDLLHTVRS
jgi:kinesin family protein 3/17